MERNNLNNKERFEKLKENSTFMKQQIFGFENRIFNNLSNEKIEKILQERGIIFDIKGIKEETVETTNIPKNTQIILEAKYGLNTKIKNINNFIYFCAIHGFIPIIDKIEINNQDVSKIKELYSIFELALKNNDYMIRNILLQEIVKLHNTDNETLKTILNIVEKINQYTNQEYQKILGEKVQKIRNDGVISENIFVELALRMENNIRDQVGIYSTYLHLASEKEDNEKKQDMKLITKKTEKQNYSIIPLQFTVGSSHLIENKLPNIEEVIFNSTTEQDSQYQNFCVLGVNGKFADTVKNSGKHEYNKWTKNPQLREQQQSKKFPFFIDTMKEKNLISAEIMYIALHMLIKKYSFKNSEKTDYINALQKNGKIDRNNKEYIDTIKVNEITTQNTKVKKISKKIHSPKETHILKYSTEIRYLGEKMGTIVMYSK